MFVANLRAYLHTAMEKMKTSPTTTKNKTCKTYSSCSVFGPPHKRPFGPPQKKAGFFLPVWSPFDSFRQKERHAFLVWASYSKGKTFHWYPSFFRLNRNGRSSGINFWTMVLPLRPEVVPRWQESAQPKYAVCPTRHCVGKVPSTQGQGHYDFGQVRGTTILERWREEAWPSLPCTFGCSSRDVWAAKLSRRQRRQRQEQKKKNLERHENRTEEKHAKISATIGLPQDF